MQSTSRYLANNKVTIIANLDGLVTEYRPVYNRTLQVYRGIDNLLHFEAKNHDQKPISLAGYIPKFVAFDENNHMIIERDGTVVDDAITRTTVIAESSPDNNLEFASTSGIQVGQTVSGIYIKTNTLVTAVEANRVTLNKSPSESVPLGSEITFQTRSRRGVFTVNVTENDLLNLKQQYLKYAIYLVNTVGDKTLTYANAHFDAEGIIYVNGTAFPGPVATHTVSTFIQSDQNPVAWYSESIDAQPGINGNEALHTVAVYTSSYSGNVIVQGTLENQVTLDTAWADITSLTFDGTEAEPVPVNFNGVFSHLRFKVNSSPAGTITKILVRN
jgi:hypothetical protein